MLTCKEFMQELNEYLDETTTVEVRAELQKHINECPNCWVVVDTTRKTMQVYKGMEPHPVPENVQNRLMAALAKKMKDKRAGC